MNRLIGAGGAAFLAGVMLMGTAFVGGGSGTVQAGEGCPTTVAPSPTPDPTVELTGQGVTAFGVECPTATPTTRRRTATPEPTTPTPEPTEDAPTSVPPTTIATTAPPTAPSGGAGGGGIAPPNTGDGSAAGDAGMMWLIATGALMALTGGGLALVGVRRR